MQINPPILQIALDYADTSEALEMAKIGVEAGFDWLEAGTPLIVARGLAAIGALAKAFPDYPGVGRLQNDGFGRQERRAHARTGRQMDDGLRECSR